MQKTDQIKKKVGCKPLPRHLDRIAVVCKKMEALRIPVAVLRRSLTVPISYNNLVVKLKSEIGLHDEEIVAIEKAVNKIEKSIMAKLNNG